jgi:hypothetical protein
MEKVAAYQSKKCNAISVEKEKVLASRLKNYMEEVFREKEIVTVLFSEQIGAASRLKKDTDLGKRKYLPICVQ